MALVDSEFEQARGLALPLLPRAPPSAAVTSTGDDPGYIEQLSQTGKAYETIGAWQGSGR